MYSKSKNILASIPEKEVEINESDVDTADTKWVPKKKHEVLKAKYKCLKKLFQIYDASVMGILPKPCGQGDSFTVEERDEGRKSRRKKRSHRTRTDACAGTTDFSSEVSEPGDQDNVATAVGLKIQGSNTLTAQTVNTSVTTLQSEIKQNSVAPSETVYEHPYHCAQNRFQQPAYCVGERRKPTRFQSFLQRLLGIRREPCRRALNGHVLAASDDEINQHYVEKRRRRGLRCRRLRRPRKVQSEGSLRELPLLDYAQAVQRNCLLDTTPRQCPISGCRNMFYVNYGEIRTVLKGIINYNDHLNMCHFPSRRFVCHFCHEGFENDADKLHHESEHVGLSRLTPFLSAPTRAAVTSDTQTDPNLTSAAQDKLKIVSFFDKSGYSKFEDIKDNGSRYSETNLKPASESGRSYASSCKRTSSCVDTYTHGRFSDLYRVRCSFCGEKFEDRRQLSVHVDLEHGIHDKFSKFHSCVSTHHPRTAPGQLTITSAASTLNGSPSTISQCSSEKSNLTMMSKPSMGGSITGRLKGMSLKWEPGTKIIRV